MRITPINFNYRQPSFGSITYRIDPNKGVTADVAKRVQDDVEQAINTAPASGCALLHLLALADIKEKNSKDDYPASVTIGDPISTIKLPKIKVHSFDEYDCFSEEYLQDADNYMEDYMEQSDNSTYEIKYNPEVRDKERSADNLIFSLENASNEAFKQHTNDKIVEFLHRNYGV